MAGSDNSKAFGIPAWQRTTPEATTATTTSDEAQTAGNQEPETTDTHSIEETGLAPGPEETTVSKSEGNTLSQVRQFLESPDIRNAPEGKKRVFLESKGVSKEMIEKVLVEIDHTQKVSFDAAEFKSMKSRPVTSPTSRDVPPIVTYPEFLIQPQKPPPLVTISRLVNTAYVAGGFAAVMYGLSKFIIAPMAANLTEARHEFAEHTEQKMATVNEKLSDIVTSVPVKLKVLETNESDDDSIASDPTELYHRDMATQTSPHISRRPSISSPEIPSAGFPTDTRTVIEKQHDRLKIMSSHLDELLLDSNSNGTTNQQVQESVSELKEYLGNLMYATPSMMEGIWTPGGTQEKKKQEDAITAFKAEIRSVKGVLLSAKRFPSSAPLSTRVGG